MKGIDTNDEGSRVERSSDYGKCRRNRLPDTDTISHHSAEWDGPGNVGIYRGSGEVREGLVQEILTKIPAEKIIWEAPQKAQQLYFLELIGCNVNLGNIAPSEIIPLEAMRIGLRGDTFHLYLNK